MIRYVRGIAINGSHQSPEQSGFIRHGYVLSRERASLGELSLEQEVCRERVHERYIKLTMIHGVTRWLGCRVDGMGCSRLRRRLKRNYTPAAPDGHSLFMSSPNSLDEILQS